MSAVRHLLLCVITLPCAVTLVRGLFGIRSALIGFATGSHSIAATLMTSAWSSMLVVVALLALVGFDSVRRRLGIRFEHPRPRMATFDV